MKAKLNMPRDLKSNLSIKKRNKVNREWEKFGCKIPKNSREALLLDKKNGNTFWADAIVKEIKGLERLGVLQFYQPNCF